MKPGDKIDNYTLLHECGKGAFGSVYFAQDDSGRHVAFKAVSLLGDGGDRELQAIECFKRCPECDALLKIYHVVKKDEYFYYTMELADNILGNKTKEYKPATLAEVLRQEKKLSVLQTEELLSQLLIGLNIIHNNNLVHRDIKPANIIWVNGRAKLSDIGLMSNDLSMTYKAGSDGYLPAKGSPIPENSTTVDLYALTRLIFCCLSGKTVEHYPDLDWADAQHYAGSNLLNLMTLSDEELLKMDAADFQQQLAESVSGKTMIVPQMMYTASSIGSKTTSNNHLAALSSLTKLASAESWIQKHKLTKNGVISIVAGTVATIFGGILLGKFLKNNSHFHF